MTRPERRPCVCRGHIWPQPGEDVPYTESIDAHNATDRHTAWRHREIYAGNLVLPETPAELVTRHLGIPTPVVRPIQTDPELVTSRRDPWDGEL